jgi:hypothetical protein
MKDTVRSSAQPRQGSIMAVEKKQSTMRELGGRGRERSELQSMHKNSRNYKRFDPKGAKEFSGIANEIFAPIYPVIAEQIIKRCNVLEGMCIDVGTGASNLADDDSGFWLHFKKQRHIGCSLQITSTSPISLRSLVMNPDELSHPV